MRERRALLRYRFELYVARREHKVMELIEDEGHGANGVRRSHANSRWMHQQAQLGCIGSNYVEVCGRAIAPGANDGGVAARVLNFIRLNGNSTAKLYFAFADRGRAN